MSFQTVSGAQNVHSGLSSLGHKTWETNVVLQRLSGPCTACSLLSEGDTGARHPSLQVSAYLAPFSGAFRFWEEIICSENSCFIVLVDWSRLTGPQPPVNMNEGLSCSFKTRLHVDLQCTLFPSEPSKHDPLLSQAIPPSPHWWVSKLLKFPSPDAPRRWPGLRLALLWIAQGHRRGEGGGRQSIYQDVLLYFFYPSQRRWFYFSENPLNSDQVRWLLSLETQELSGHNRYKC